MSANRNVHLAQRAIPATIQAHDVILHRHELEDTFKWNDYTDGNPAKFDDSLVHDLTRSMIWVCFAGVLECRRLSITFVHYSNTTCGLKTERKGRGHTIWREWRP